MVLAATLVARVSVQVVTQLPRYRLSRVMVMVVVMIIMMVMIIIIEVIFLSWWWLS